MKPEETQTQAHLQVPETADGVPGSDPIAVFRRVWSVTERIAMSASILLVFGTIGYLSLKFLSL
jgi:hypothetical protein